MKVWTYHLISTIHNSWQVVSYELWIVELRTHVDPQPRHAYKLWVVGFAVVLVLFNN